MYKITDETIEAMINECPEAEKVLRKGFPEAFREKWVLVDPSRISVRVYRGPGTIFYIQVDGEDVAWICNQRLELLYAEMNYRISTMTDGGELLGNAVNFIYEKK